MRRQLWVAITAATLSVWMCSCGKEVKETGATMAADKTNAVLQTENMISLQEETSGIERVSGNFH